MVLLNLKRAHNWIPNSKCDLHLLFYYSEGEIDCTLYNVYESKLYAMESFLFNQILKGIQSFKLIFFYINSCQYSMFYTDCSWNFSLYHTNEIRRFLIFLYPLKNSMLTRTIFIYSMTYKVNLFGKAFAHVRNCLREKHMYGTNKNIDGFYTKTTQIWGFRVKN